jgi:hypothetical protein
MTIDTHTINLALAAGLIVIGFCLGFGWHVAAWLVALITQKSR